MNQTIYTNIKGQEYYLFYKDIKLKYDRVQRIYFFTRTNEASTGSVPTELPEGYEVYETVKTKLPVVRKVKK